MKTGFSRRNLLKILAVVFGSGVVSACERFLTPQTPIPTSTPLTTRIPSPTTTLQTKCSADAISALSQVILPEGKRYLTNVPDTLDLHENALLVINALTRCTNPDDSCETYFYGSAARNPPVMFKADGLNSKFCEGLSLMRHLTGSTFNTQVDQRWREYFLEMFQKGSTGLTFTDARFICWAANNSQQEKSVCWQEVAEEAVNRLSKILTHERDYCYLTNSKGEMNTGWEATQEGWTLQGITSVYSITGSSSARKLADELARYLKDHAQIFDTDGHFLARHESGMGPALHFHHNGNAMAALSEYALATHDQEFVDFVQKGYEYARSVGWPLVGFFPEYIEDWPDDRPYIDCETCATVDMIMMATNLSKLGQGDYWDDVDRYVRNQFTEMQMKNGDWINEVAKNYLNTPVGPDEDGDQVSDRAVGSFAGWASANDYCANRESPIISGCCTGNGARAIFHVLENMLEFDNGKLSVHLLLNHASPWADVNSYIPFSGQIDILMKTACNVEIRIPEWVKPEEVTCSVNNAPREVNFQGRYAQVGSVESGNVVTMNFPISERTVTTSLGNVSYTLIIKGNDVISIDPPGQWHAFYHREHYREKVRWVNRERFVPVL